MSSAFPTKPKVNMVLLGPTTLDISWPIGEIWHSEKSNQAIHDLVLSRAKMDDADAWLFWNSDLEPPNPDAVLSLMVQPVDVWHAGLRLNQGKLPGLLNFVHPTWMFNRDADHDQPATSWRLSLEACLIRTSVLRRLGIVCPAFKTLAGASLETGHRYLLNGVIVRHVPLLLPTEIPAALEKVPFEDEWLFLFRRRGLKWTLWALGRALLTGYAPPGKVLKAVWKVLGMPAAEQPAVYEHVISDVPLDASMHRVTVLIPTLERYDYLRKLLDQLRKQTVPPFEIILVDQTPLASRQTAMAEEFNDLPLTVIYLDEQGQCSARNHGLRSAKGEFILFLDDDTEVGPHLIESHLRTLNHFQAVASSGVSDEVNRDPFPREFRLVRCSDVFPTANTMIRLSSLEPSGLFDLGYERSDKEDGDLGMRLYLSGALMILNPNIRVIHHHAPRGGLRFHGVRLSTYARSRKRLQRLLPSVTEIYLWKRYFTRSQVKERMWLSLMGTFSYHGNPLLKITKFILGIFRLPDTLWRLQLNSKAADEMFPHFPQIPSFTARQPTEIRA